MQKWIAITPLVLLAACSKPNTPAPAASNPNPAAAGTVAQAPPPASPQPVDTAPPAAPPAPAEAAPDAAPTHSEVVIPSGVALRVRLDQTLDTRRNRPGDSFSATLTRPVVVHGETVIPTGARLRGHVIDSAASGRMQGRAVLGITLDSLRVGGSEHRIRTSEVSRVGAAHKKRNGILIGGGAGLGAAIGAIAGGGKGAAIGAVAGGGAGAAGAAATGKEEISLPAETALAFTLKAPLRL